MVCKGMGNRVTQTVYTQSFTIGFSDREKWIDIVFEAPVPVDYTTDLWIVIHSESAGDVYYNAYTGEGSGNAALYAGSLDSDFQQKTKYDWMSGGDVPASFLIRTTLTEGSYSYNVYKDDVKIAQDLSETTYGATLEANKPNVFTVTTNYYGGESSASNSVGHALGNATIETVLLSGNDVLTIAEGSTLTVSGFLTNDNSDNLIIEDGGQLLHSSEGVKATVKKNITAYSTANGVNDGWHLIGYPFAENGLVTDMANLFQNKYDLYYYDEPTHYWKNQELAANGFTELKPAKGYLYANSGGVSLGLIGTLKAGNATVNLPLDYTAKAGRLKGFNLVGNPFAHNVTSFTGTNVATDVYRMNETKDDLTVSTIDEDNPLKPGEGFFVKATSAGASITFNDNGGTKGKMAKTGRINLELRENGMLIDRLIVKQDGEPLEKLSLKENSTKLFALRDNQEMAVAVIEDNEQPINFKAAKNGEYTLSFNLDGVELDYLHLIDNMIGADVDLLQTNEYSFNGKTTDYASRFRLVFSTICEDVNGDNEAFAYIDASGNIVITADEVEDAGAASLQVVDMMGRVVVSAGGHTRCVPTTGIPAGVYVMRLIDGENVRTQKIVVR